MERPPILQTRGLSKTYGHVTALDGVNFDLHRGEVVAVVGDNGAGKSTFIKIISGAIGADSGAILVNGSPVSIKSPQDSRRLGIETVYQDLALVPSLDIEANLFLGREMLRRPGPLRFLDVLDKRAMRERALDHLASLKIGITSVKQSVESLSGGQRQGVAVARAVAWGQHIIIMDEPTAALGVQEAAKVLDLIQHVRAAGLSVILISHNLVHVFSVADTVVAFRQGQVAGRVAVRESTMAQVVGMIMGATEPLSLDATTLRS